MGQKVNPHGLRVGVIKDWDSRWFARDNAFGDILVEDYNLRKFLKKSLYDAGIPKIEIERDATRVRIHIHCARPGVVIGKGGTEIETLRLACEAIINKNRKDQPMAVAVNVIEV
ncbi:MAG: KH domain-containing protein, partial [Raoultibacter sp.]